MSSKLLTKILSDCALFKSFHSFTQIKNIYLKPNSANSLGIMIRNCRVKAGIDEFFVYSQNVLRLGLYFLPTL